MKISKSNFGKTKEGVDADLFTLTNDNNVNIKISNYGAIITSVQTPDKNGKLSNIVCGFDTLDEYLSNEYLASYPYFGCICGRVCNRIAEGNFSLEGVNYSLAVNNGSNHLHGGLVGFDKKIWKASIIETNENIGVEMSYLSADMEEGYPGNLEVKCNYLLNNNNDLIIEYSATTDKTTIINITNHSYFNLTGNDDNIFNHFLQLNADKYTESIEMIPSGNIISVEGTPFDFTSPKTLGSGINELENGYDLNYALKNQDGNLAFAGVLSEETSGRKVEVFTTQPGIQLYTGYWIPELIIDGKKKFGSYSGVALETQHYPDSINHKDFPNTVLKKGDKFSEKTIYKFGLL